MKDLVFPTALIAFVVVMITSAFYLAFEIEREKERCIDSGYVYIDKHCYKSLPLEVNP